MLRNAIAAFCLVQVSIASAANGQQILSGGTSAQDNSVQTDNKVEANEIVVIGLKDPFVLTGRQLQNIVAAFVRGRPQYAPAARLAIEVKDIGQGIRAARYCRANGCKRSGL